jgi:phosphopantetheine adenylyltransferase
MTRGELSYISSSTVKEIKSLGGDVSEMVPPAALEYLERKFNV